MVEVAVGKAIECEHVIIVLRQPALEVVYLIVSQYFLTAMLERRSPMPKGGGEIGPGERRKVGLQVGPYVGPMFAGVNVGAIGK